MFNFKKIKLNRGMTYVELIVVLSIGAVLSSVVLFNYRDFQDKIDMKNLASDLASQIIEMQRASISGKIPTHTIPPDNWRPSYGAYFNLQEIGNKTFYTFSDMYEQDKRLESVDPCPGVECMSRIDITKGNYINNIYLKYIDGKEDKPIDLHITFTRPNSGAVFYSNGSELVDLEYVEILLNNRSNSTRSSIFIYPSGRVQIK